MMPRIIPMKLMEVILAVIELQIQQDGIRNNVRRVQ